MQKHVTINSITSTPYEIPKNYNEGDTLLIIVDGINENKTIYLPDATDCNHVQINGAMVDLNGYSVTFQPIVSTQTINGESNFVVTRETNNASFHTDNNNWIIN